MSKDMLPAIVIDHMSKHYSGKHGVSDISLAVATGEVFGFLGPNGAGKSTTINTILDILRPDSGTIRVLGMDHHTEAKQVHKRIGYLSGDMETDPSLNGEQYLTFVAHLYGDVKKDRIEELATRLKADTRSKIKHLSRGSKQKIGLIAALMHEPELLILDEPTSGLDPLIQAEFNTIINEYKSRGKTVFISSHVLSEVQSVCDRVGFIRDGQLVTASPLEDLLEQAPRRVTAGFKTQPPLPALKALAGSSKLTSSGNTATFLFNGDINKLVTLLHAHSLNDVRIAEIGLDELFMSYYSNKKGGADV